MIRTRFNSPPDTVILIVGCAVPSHARWYSDAEWILAVTNLRGLLRVGRGPEDLCVIDEDIGVERLNFA